MAKNGKAEKAFSDQVHDLFKKHGFTDYICFARKGDIHAHFFDGDWEKVAETIYWRTVEEAMAGHTGFVEIMLNVYENIRRNEDVRFVYEDPSDN